jgi:transmembrane sensor
MPANDIESDAANWLIRLERDPSPQNRADFETWLAADPRHQAAYIRLEKTWNRAEILKRLRPLDGVVDEQVIDKFGVQTPVYDEPQPKASRTRTALMAVAASLGIITMGISMWAVIARTGWEVYQTEFGGFQRVVLADGSTAMLNTDSRIRARLTSGRREVVLEKGEALFTVAHDVHRPFDVTAGETVVRAVGTAFSVRLRDKSQVDVLVTEGRVAIDPVDDSVNTQLPQPVAVPTASTLAAGETASVKQHRPLKVRKIADEDVTRKLAWTQGRIWFDRVTLAEAVAEFNRYNRKQLVIEDPEIAELHIGGAFEATDLDSFVMALRTFGIQAVSTTSQTNGVDSEEIRLSADHSNH